MNEMEKKFFEEARATESRERAKALQERRAAEALELENRAKEVREQAELHRRIQSEAAAAAKQREQARTAAARAKPYHERVAGLDTGWIRIARLAFGLSVIAGFVSWISTIIYLFSEGSLPQAFAGIAISLFFRSVAAFVSFFFLVAVPIGLYTLCSAVIELVEVLQLPHEPAKIEDQNAA